ncbi:MAG: hypothetical protein H2038_04430 [Brevundimonas sp.]|uniref:hypothetical protein n=1 Tax=Brevundimonas sp. TaxID=1871086 RepID=UPI0017F2E2AA|nr:hypothetical protein [Brevundimonas sp.]MBA4803881.1 hypothetical protein [Brevundimonas sp.]
MRKFAFLAPLTLAVALAAAAQAQPAAVTVTLAPEFESAAEDLGRADVQAQMDRLAEVVTRALADDPDLAGARIELVLTDLRPNRPTTGQLRDRPGLDPVRSISTGGATIDGRIVTADGRELPVHYERYSDSLSDVYGVGVWHDAERAWRGLAANLEAGRYVQR